MQIFQEQPSPVPVTAPAVTAPAGMTTVESSFLSAGVRCAATLYLPEGIDTPPVIVMAHGFGATRVMRLPDYAARFVAEGWAVLTFDYRCWGDSEGHPRNNLDPQWQISDLLAAVAHARSLPQVDPRRIALWGTAFSGAHVVVAASRDQRITALVAQGPLASGLRASRSLPIAHQLRGTCHAVADVVSAKLLRRRHNVRIAGDYRRDGGRFAIAAGPDALPGEIRLHNGDAESYHRMNFMPAAFAFSFLRYRPIASASRVGCPALILGMERDHQFGPTGARAVAARIPDATYRGYPIGHWGPYFDDNFEEFVAQTITFLHQHLDTCTAQTGSPRRRPMDT
jgi:pimeloyl-ACP methyl ester carboxylesterase